MMNKQCSRRTPGLPAWPRAARLAGLLVLIPASAAAQERYRVSVTENFRQEAGADGRLLARVNPGAVVTGGARREGFVEVTLEGWVWEQSVRASPTAGFDLAVRTAGGENLRDSPSGRVVARLLEGFLLDEVGRRDGWIQVRRSGWMWERSLTREAAPRPAAAVDAGVSPPAEPAPRAQGLDRMIVSPGARLLATPEGDTLATVRGALAGRVVARAGGWARVRTETWVRETDLSLAADSVMTGVSGAEVRTEGRTWEGRLLRWDLQFVALQTADELRRDIPAGQRYVLARGPLPEAGFVYLTLSPPQAIAFQGLAPLSYLTVVGRVRTARSRYLGNPILELVDYVVSQQ
jgi:hypothetical protein